MIANYYILLLLFSLFQLCFLEKLRVYTKNACFEGKSSSKFRNVVEFLGIPFATPPVGKYRFKAPRPVAKDGYGKGCFKASTPAKTCYFERESNGFVGIDEWQPKSLNMSEDCLQLNMWVPKNKTGAVIVFIFGKGYYMGSPSLPQYEGSALASMTGSIVINLNYRLGVLGFAFYKHGHIIPGNMGLLDQQLGLEWIYQNIEKFGGKKSMITIMGDNQGASSATAHLFSHGSEKYFSKIVAVSGTILNSWALEKSHVLDSNFRKLMDKMNCSHKNEDVEIKCMQTADVSKLIRMAGTIKNSEQLPIVYPFLPMDNDGFFFKNSLTKLLDQGQMKKNFDILIGKTTDEATIYMHKFMSCKRYGCSFDPKKNPESLVNQCLMNKFQYIHSIKLLVQSLRLRYIAIRKIMKLYGERKRQSFRHKASRIYADFLFDCDYVEFAKKISKYAANKYFYVMGKTSALNAWSSWMGVTNDYQTHYIFGHPFLNPKKYGKKISNELKFSTQVMKTLGKFVKEGRLFKSWRQFKRREMVAAHIIHVLKEKDRFRNVVVDTRKCKMIKFIKRRYKIVKSPF
uniref:Acetylcholinesterase n=1 Tax=Strongyloides papillosus TaxID=174720 RepID=A0A0N5B7D0_STREA